MLQVGETFFTSVGCMDGRVQDSVAEFGRQKFNAQFGDTITEAGLVGLLSKITSTASNAADSQKLLESIKNKIQISLDKHHSKGIVVHGHQECAGNQVDDEKHKEDVQKSVEVIKSFVTSVPVLGVFIKSPSTGSGFAKLGWVVEEI